MSIHINWWAIPAAITLASFGYALKPERDNGAPYGQGIVALLVLLAATVVSLAAWLVWALLA